MNQFSIFYLLALFCISFAPAQAERELKNHYKIKEARFDRGEGYPAKTFKNGPVYLCEIHGLGLADQYYAVIDNAGDISNNRIDFEIEQCYTLVTRDDRIIVKHTVWTITLVLEENAFAFYKRMFPLGNFDHNFPAKIFRGRKVMDNVSAIKAKGVAANKPFFIAFNDSTNTPCLVFPRKRVEVRSIKRCDTDVFFSLQTGEDLPIPITIKFDNSTDATTFYDLVTAGSVILK